MLPITEMSNLKSINIDIQTPIKIAEIIFECEQEIFGGFGNYQGLFDLNILNKCVSVANEIRTAIEKNKSTNIILIGAGTSGRLCRLIATILKRQFSYKANLIPIIAGGIKALIRAEPNTEDNFETGKEDYYKYTEHIDKSNCFLFGVSCGLSASYVNGAIEANLKHSNYKSVIIGFNPVEQATISLIEHNNFTIINPIIGPEPIVGSVRMKGGTATMILLYSIINSGLNTQESTKKILDEIINKSQTTLLHSTVNFPKISKIIDKLGNSLNTGGQINILGLSDFGVLAIYDAAECPPTFGAEITQINGYTKNGIIDLVFYDFEVKENLPKEISFGNYFTKQNEYNISKDTVLIVANNSDDLFSIENDVITNDNTILVFINDSSNHKLLNTHHCINFNFWEQNDFYKILFVRSLFLNFSTGAFILNGKVYENKMIDLRITNKKLFYRASRIISQITNFKETDVSKLLQQKIRNGSDTDFKNLTEFIKISAMKTHIVPKTILSLLYLNKTELEINAMLNEQPIIRKLIEREIKKAK